jgi:hypothetical protein
MRIVLVGIAALLFVVGCGSDGPGPTITPSPAPQLRPLPPNVSGVPEPGNPNTAVIPPHSRPGELEVGVARNFTIGHCGLATPIDIHGSLWNPVAGQDAQGGPLTEDHIGELINSTPTAIVLTSQGVMEMRTPRGAIITLARHEGERRYYLCD